MHNAAVGKQFVWTHQGKHNKVLNFSQFNNINEGGAAIKTSRRIREDEFDSTLSSIKDGNDFTEYTHNSVGIWTYSQNVLNSPSSNWSAGNFYVYRKTLSTTVPPSQIYKFNF